MATTTVRIGDEITLSDHGHTHGPDVDPTTGTIRNAHDLSGLEVECDMCHRTFTVAWLADDGERRYVLADEA